MKQEIVIAADLVENYEHACHAVGQREQFHQLDSGKQLLMLSLAATKPETLIEGLWDVADLLKDAIERLSRAEANLQIMQWKPITPENLPQVGDEVGGVGESDSYPWMCRAVTGGTVKQRNANPQDRDWERLGYTHFRPIAPPKGKVNAEDAGRDGN